MKSAMIFGVFRPLAVLCLLSSGALVALPTAQSGAEEAPGGTSVGGLVEQDGQPMGGVVLVLSGRGLSRPLVAITDSDGQFTFQTQVDGEFQLAVRSPAQVIALVNGVTWLGEQVPIGVSAGKRASVVVTLSRGGVIAGVVRDPFGAPLSSARVSVFRKPVASATTLPEPTIVVTTNNQGAYRAYGLRPAEYLVQAMARPFSGSRGLELVNEEDYRQAEQTSLGSGVYTLPVSRPQEAVEYLATYFGGTSLWNDATPVMVNSGVEAPGVNIQVSLSRAVTMRGVLTRADGQPVPAGRVYLLPDEPGTSLNGSTALPVDADGRFVRERLMPGRYRLVGEVAAGVDGVVGKGALDIRIPGTDLSDVRLVVSELHGLEGRVHLDPADELTRRQLLQAVRVTMRRVGNGVQVVPFDVVQTTVDTNGTFVVNGLLPGNYSLTVHATPAGNRDVPLLESIDSAGSPLADGIVRIPRKVGDVIGVHLSSRPAQLSGELRGWTGGGPLWVLVFPENPMARQLMDRVRLTQVHEGGRYRVSGIPQGTYLVAVVSGGDLTGLIDVATLEEAARVATPVRLERGEARHLDLQVSLR
jgi:hypothetical protein